MRAREDETGPIEKVVTALYGSISFEDGGSPDITLLRTLFHPEGRLIRMTPEGPSVMSLETFVSLFREQVESGFLKRFREREIFCRTETFGSIAHVMSTYEASYEMGGEEGVSRGINSIQLVREGGRWRVVSILWEDEGEDSPIPEEYLPEDSA